jgi:uncharacterized membrane protein YkoI
MTIRPILLVSVAAATLALPAGSKAQAPPLSPHQVYFLGQAGQRDESILSVRDIIAAVRRELGAGDVIGSPRLEEGGGRSSYIVRWRRPNGVVVDVRVDARSGRVIGQAG